MRIRRLVLFVAALGVAAACGGDGTPKVFNASPSPGQTSPTPGATPDGVNTGAPAGTTSPKSSPKTSPAASPTGTPATTAALDKSCVRRGASDDRQGLRVTTTPRGPYGYATVYSDGSDITGHPEYEPDGPNGPVGGQGGGFTDANGVGYEQWIVPPTAPLGEATVKVNAGGTIFDLKFRVVAKTGTCS